MYRSCAAPQELGMTLDKPCITRNETLDGTVIHVQFCGCNSTDNCNKYSIDANTGNISGTAVTLDVTGIQGEAVVDSSSSSTVSSGEGSGGQTSDGSRVESTGYAFCGFEFTLVVLIRLFEKLMLRNTYSIHYSVQRCLFCCYIRIRPQWISNLDRCHYCSRQMKYACTAVYSVRRYLEGLPNQISQFITRVSSAPYSV